MNTLQEIENRISEVMRELDRYSFLSEEEYEETEFAKNNIALKHFAEIGELEKKKSLLIK